GEHLLGVALSSLMRVPAERRAELYAESLQRIARSGENDWRRFLLAECVEAYADLDEAQRQRVQALLATEKYQDVRPVMITTYERGKIEGRREMALRLLEKKFGPLSPEARRHMDALTYEELGQIAENVLDAQSLKELGIEA